MVKTTTFYRIFLIGFNLEIKVLMCALEKIWAKLHYFQKNLPRWSKIATFALLLRIKEA